MSFAEEYDPATGTFRPIADPAAKAPPPRARKPAAPRRKATGLSESGERYGVIYEVFEAGLKTDTAKYAVWASYAVIVVVFVLLLYEAITYRLALG